MEVQEQRKERKGKARKEARIVEDREINEEK